MTTVKIIAALIASVIALFSALFGVASAMSIGTNDPRERRDATVSAFWSLLTLALCAAAIVTLAGCQTAKTIIDTCQDGLCR